MKFRKLKVIQRRRWFDLASTVAIELLMSAEAAVLPLEKERRNADL